MVDFMNSEKVESVFSFLLNNFHFGPGKIFAVYKAGIGCNFEGEAVITQSAATPRDGQGPSDPMASCSEDLWETRLDFTGITSERSAESAKSG
jgi:hypothetical protein